MTVEEVRSLLPKADLYEIDPNARYVILVDPVHVSEAVVARAASALRPRLNGVIISVTERSAVRIFEIGK